MKKSILVVDDNEEVRDLISYHLLNKGYNVLFACNGNDAMEVLKTEKIDLLLSDIRMPECDGLTLMKKVKAAEDINPVCFLMTGLSQIPLEEVKKIGVKKVFHKPINRTELFNIIHDALKD